MAEAQRLREVEAERYEKERAMEMAKQQHRETAVAKDRIGELEAQLQRMQAQWVGQKVELEAQMDEQRQLLVSTQERTDSEVKR